MLKPSNRAEHRVYIFAADSLVTVIPRCRRRDRHSFRRLCLPCCFHVNGFDTHSEALDMAVAEGANFSDMVESMDDGGLSSADDEEGEGGYIVSCSCQEELCSVKKKRRTQWKKIPLHLPSSILHLSSHLPSPSAKQRRQYPPLHTPAYTFKKVLTTSTSSIPTTDRTNGPIPLPPLTSPPRPV